MATILVVDDDPQLRESIRRVLELKGHTVTEAPDGKVALRHFAGTPTDLVVSDVYMPDMDGIEFLMRLREAFPDVKTLMISGGGSLPSENVLGAASMLGADRVLEKPFTLEELQGAVQAILSD